MLSWALLPVGALVFAALVGLSLAWAEREWPKLLAEMDELGLLPEDPEA